MTYRFDAAALVAKGYTAAVVLAYDLSLAEPAGTLLSKHRTFDAAELSQAAKRSDTKLVFLADVADEQARQIALIG